MLHTNIAGRASARIPVSVDSDASGDEIVGWHDGTLAIRVAAGLDHGEADSAVETLLADVLGVARGQVNVVFGRSDPLKLVEVDGVGEELVEQRLPGRAESRGRADVESYI
jgi:uncharacterized protein YggU (UPF0235/DUF167 family)